MDEETNGLHTGKHIPGASGGSTSAWYVESAMTEMGYTAMAASGQLDVLPWRAEVSSCPSKSRIRPSRSLSLGLRLAGCGKVSASESLRKASELFSQALSQTELAGQGVASTKDFLLLKIIFCRILGAL